MMTLPGLRLAAAPVAAATAPKRGLDDVGGQGAVLVARLEAAGLVADGRRAHRARLSVNRSATNNVAAPL